MISRWFVEAQGAVNVSICRTVVTRVLYLLISVQLTLTCLFTKVQKQVVSAAVWLTLTGSQYLIWRAFWLVYIARDGLRYGLGFGFLSYAEIGSRDLSLSLSLNHYLI